MSSSFTQQDLENFVSIQPSEFESLHEVTASQQLVDGHGILVSDGVTVGNIVEVAGSGVESIEHCHDASGIEIGSLAHTLSDMELLSHPGKLVSGDTDEMVVANTEDISHSYPTGATDISADLSSAGNPTAMTTQMYDNSGSSQILKTSLGQFVILPPNQTNLSIGAPKNRLIGSSGTAPIKTVYVSSSSIHDTAAGKPHVILSPSGNQQQFRTIQLKQTSGPFTQITNSGQQFILQKVASGTMTKTTPAKVIIPVSVKSPTKIAPAPAASQSSALNTSTVTVRHLSSPQKFFVKNNLQASTHIGSLRAGQGIHSGSQVVKIPVSHMSQITNQHQNIQVLPNKVSYVRIVNPNTATSSTVPVINASSSIIRNASNKPIAPAIKVSALPLISQGTKQKLLIPSISQSGPVNLKQAGSITLPASALPSGVLSNAQPGSVVMIPAQYVSQLQSMPATTTSVVPTTDSISSSNTAGSKQAPLKTIIDANGIKPRKPCNCTKSQCLKLYCDCFANGEFCNNCNCNSCYNNLEQEEERQKAIKACLERNPSAFRPKIGKGGSENERRHNKGCNCKRSGCLKNYCECFEAKIPCSTICKCVGCKNVDLAPVAKHKSLMQLAECVEAQVSQQMAFKSRPLSLTHHSPVQFGMAQSRSSGFCRMNQEVVEATCHCLLAQADKAERNKVSFAELERTVIAEFSRCLMHIIGSCSTKSKGFLDS